MLKIKIKNEWSFLTTANTITTNKTAITDEVLTGEDKKTKIKQQKKQNKNKTKIKRTKNEHLGVYLLITLKLWNDYLVWNA